MNRFRKWLLPCAPGFFGFFFIYLMPFALTVRYSLLSDLFSREFVGMENYLKLSGNPYFRLAMKNVLIFSGMASVLTLVLSILLSYLLLPHGNRYVLLRAVMVAPFFIPSSAVIRAWGRIFPPAFYGYGLPDAGLGSYLAQLPLLVIFLWKNLGFCFLITYLSLQGIPREVIEAAQVDGAGRGRTFRDIRLKMIVPNLYFALLLVFVSSLSVYRESMLYYNTQYPPNAVYLLQNFMNNHFEKMNYENLAAASVLFVGGISVLVILLFGLGGREGKTS